MIDLRMITSQMLIQYLQDRYQVKPEYIFAKHPDYAVFRHPLSQKWFGLFMQIPGTKLGLQTTSLKPVLNLKLDPEFIDVLRQQTGYYPAYHMNKQHWISIDLAQVADLAEIVPLIEDSYLLTR